MIITTEEAELLARISDINGPTRRGAIIRSLAAERDALQAEVKRLGAASNHYERQVMRAAQRHEAAMARADKLQAENARLREALARAKDLFLQDEPQKAFIEVCAALGETQ
jgi:chromosome segregation ATPase